jgi:outer membrane protein assembly factor BamE (lipoprotein component of BamABCDE complex)
MRQLRLSALLAALIAVSGCSMLRPPPAVRGNKVTPDELGQLVAGKTTQTQATDILGSPTAKGTFDPNNWYYISETTRPVIAGTQGVLAQEVVVLDFDNQGVLQRVTHLTQKNAKNVPIIARETPSPGTNASFIQQLLGNIGRFNPGINTPGAPSGGAPTGP